MLLSGKSAILYGAAGHISRAVGQAFAREGARLFLAGRDSKSLAVFADELRRKSVRPRS
jgi:NAD(P)-dependent dehydrogenase (short-subunit alcohol dehydrogenase family)